MQKKHQTNVSPLTIKTSHMFEENNDVDPPQIEWQTVTQPSRGQAMLKNLGVAAALVLCAVTLRTGAIPALSPATDAVLTAATDQSLLDDQLGKLSFVSALFPETVLVFGESDQPELVLPVSGGMLVHAWSEDEPYLSLRTSGREVMASFSGEVSGVYHGNGDERLVQISHENGLTCLYGNLESVAVMTGDHISAGDVLGGLLPGEDLVFEVRQHGVSVDPAKYLQR